MTAAAVGAAASAAVGVLALAVGSAGADEAVAARDGDVVCWAPRDADRSCGAISRYAISASGAGAEISRAAWRVDGSVVFLTTRARFAVRDGALCMVGGAALSEARSTNRSAAAKVEAAFRKLAEATRKLATCARWRRTGGLIEARLVSVDGEAPSVSMRALSAPRGRHFRAGDPEIDRLILRRAPFG